MRDLRDGYVSATRDVAALAVSLAAACRGPGPALFDTSVLPTIDKYLAATPVATIDLDLCARTAAFCEALAAMPHDAGPVILPEVMGEAVGLLGGTKRRANARAKEAEAAGATGAASTLRRLATAADAVADRWRAATGGARGLRGAALAAGVARLRELDRTLRLSKAPDVKGRQTDRRLVAAALLAAPATICTRDDDIRRLATAGAAGVAVQVWKFDRARQVYRCYFDGTARVDAPATARPESRA